MKSHKPAKCDVCSTPTFERNNYFYGKQFTVRDLLQEQSYFNEKRHLINRMVLGWGVVCGLDIGWDAQKCEFTVGKGMALDCCGREIVICEEQHVPFKKDYDEHCGYAREYPDYKTTFVLCLEYDDCFAEPVDLPPIGCCEKERNEFNRVRDGFKLSIKKWQKPEPHERFGCLVHSRKGYEQESGRCETETLHHYLCRTRMKHCVECEGECVVLATITVTAVKGQQYGQPKGYPEQPQGGYPQKPQYPSEPGYAPVKVDFDQCTYRRFVYSNSLLYDLIYCHHGDLPHIVEFNWRNPAAPNRELEWDTFVQLVRDGLTVYFDRKMEPASLNQHTFFLTFFHEDPDSGNIFVKRIPSREIRSDYDGDCYTATWLPDSAWFEDELLSQKSQLRSGVDVEIILRGSRIWDTRGKGLDGAFLADKLPTGNGTQGTEFVDWFKVLPREKKQSYSDY